MQGTYTVTAIFPDGQKSTFVCVVASLAMHEWLGYMNRGVACTITFSPE